MQRVGRKGCGCGLGCLGIVGFVGFILWITIFSNACARMMGLETYPIAGDVAHFDPFKELDQIRAKAGPGAILTDIDATYVRMDGTMDLTATYRPGPSTDYRFVVPIAKPAGDVAPVGAGRGPGDTWFQRVTINCYQVGQMRHVTRISGSSRSEYNYHNEGMEVSRGSAETGTIPKDLGPPKMSCVELWTMAVQKGAPKDAVATIRYSQSGYDFSITGSVNFHLDSTGKER